MALPRPTPAGRSANAVNVRLVRPQMYFGGGAAEVAETLGAITSLAASQPGSVNIVFEDPQFYFGSASKHNNMGIQQQQQQHQYLMHQVASHCMTPLSQQYHGTTSILAVAPGPRMSPDPPRFESAFTVPGLDFGFELAQRRAYCYKHVDANFRLILYTQSPRSQATQSVLRVMSAGMSTKRSKHVMIMFDKSVPYQSLGWPARVRLEDVKHKLLKDVVGNQYDLCRKKVRKESFTLYLYGVKQRHTPLSPEACHEWAMLVYWADSQIGEPDGVSLSDQLASAASSMVSTAGGMLLHPLIGN